MKSCSFGVGELIDKEMREGRNRYLQLEKQIRGFRIGGHERKESREQMNMNNSRGYQIA